MAVFEPKFKRLRAMKMVEGKVMKNMSNHDLAKEFNCSIDTVERTLTWAKRADIFATYEDKIVQELIPLAHSAIRDALADGNAKIAVEVFKGLNLLRTGPAAAGSPARAAEDDLAAYIATKRDKAQLLENTITVTPRDRTLTSGEEETHATTTPEGLANGPDRRLAGAVSPDAEVATPPSGESTGQSALAPTSGGGQS